MQYKTKIESTSTEITETYCVGNKTYAAELTIHSVGVYAGMAGWDNHSVSVHFVSEIEGSITINFPKVQRTDTTHPQRMLTPDGKHFTSYAELEIESAVREFLSMKKAIGTKNKSLEHVTMNIMDEHTREHTSIRS